MSDNTRIRDVCSRFSSGKAISASKVYEEGKYPVYGGNGLRGYTDTFNFDGDYDLKYWNCKKLAFSRFSSNGYTNLHNSDFNKFRTDHHVGNDFLVLTHPHPVDIEAEDLKKLTIENQYGRKALSYSQQFLEFYRGQTEESHVLDLCCGYGRHALFL